MIPTGRIGFRQHKNWRGESVMVLRVELLDERWPTIEVDWRWRDATPDDVAQLVIDSKLRPKGRTLDA